MQVDIFNHSSVDIKKNQIILAVNKIFDLLAKKQIELPLLANHLTIVFKNAEDVRILNKRFRTKDQSTDVLSFHPIEPTSLGEIVLAAQVAQSQADKNQLSFLHETGYLILHAILHLLGYEHEAGGPKAKEMMDLQDNIFNQLIAEKITD